MRFTLINNRSRPWRHPFASLPCPASCASLPWSRLILILQFASLALNALFVAHHVFSSASQLPPASQLPAALRPAVPSVPSADAAAAPEDSHLFASPASLPLLVVWPQVLDLARTAIGLLHARNPLQSVLVVPYDLPSTALAELATVRGFVLLNAERLARASPHAMVAQLDGLAHASAALPQQPMTLLLLDEAVLRFLTGEKLGFPDALFTPPTPPMPPTPPLPLPPPPATARAIRLRTPTRQLLALKLRPNDPATPPPSLARFVSLAAPHCSLQQFQRLEPAAAASAAFDCHSEAARFLAAFAQDDAAAPLRPLALYKRNLPNCHVTHNVRHEDWAHVPRVDVAARNRSICVVTPTVGKGAWAAHPLLTRLLASALATQSGGFPLRFYVVHEWGDGAFERADRRAELEALLRAASARARNVQVFVLAAPRADGDVNHLWNLGFLKAFQDGCEFLHHLVDDVTIKTPNWDVLFTQALAEARPVANVGLAGTAFTFVSMPFVHRTHLDIFRGKFYPSETHNWFGDTFVFQTYRSRMRGARVALDNDSDLGRPGRRRYEVCDVPIEALVSVAVQRVEAFERAHAGLALQGPIEWLAGGKPVKVPGGLREV